MRKLLCLVAATALLLVGCGTQQPCETETTAPDMSTAATEPSGLYVTDSALEQETGGAIRVFDLQGVAYDWVSDLGGAPVLGSGEETSSLTMLTGDEGFVSVIAQMDFMVDLAEPGNQPIYGGFALYNKESREVVFLDGQLAETDRLEMPIQIQGAPVCSPDGSQIYYCVNNEIRCLNVELGISRLVKSHSCQDQSMIGVYLEGKVIACRAAYEDGSQAILFVSAEDGRTLSVQNTAAKLYSYQNTYLLTRKDGIVSQIIFGMDTADARQLNIREDAVFPALELGGVAGVSKTDTGVVFSYYSIPDGKKTASAVLTDVVDVKSVAADSVHSVLWLLAEMTSGEEVLLRWDMSLSAVAEETVYTGTLYTLENRDKEGLKVVQKRADALAREHGVTIRLQEEATKRNNGLELTVEYQPEAIDQALTELEKIFNMFPDNFLYKSVTTRIRICIVRSINGTLPCTRFWYDGDAYILVTPGDDLEDAFINAVSYVVESHILGNSPLVDTWSEMNPDGFAYGDRKTYSQDYLSGEQRAFVDEASMASVTDDRSRIFWQAMKADNAEMFESEIMQGKLLQLCRAIRDAWRLEKKKDVYLWEQYLTESIAYQ